MVNFTRAWSKVPFTLERVGLTLEQAKAFNIPENPDHPNAYQWEALTDEQAKTLIVNSLERFVKPVDATVLEQEKTIRSKLDDALGSILKDAGLKVKHL